MVTSRSKYCKKERHQLRPLHDWHEPDGRHPVDNRSHLVFNDHRRSVGPRLGHEDGSDPAGAVPDLERVALLGDVEGVQRLVGVGLAINTGDQRSISIKFYYLFCWPNYFYLTNLQIPICTVGNNNRLKCYS